MPALRRSNGLLFGAFLALALLAIFLSRRPGSIATVWFANALAVAWLSRVPPARWPAALGSVALANLLANLAFDSRLVQAIAFVPGNLIEITLGAVLLRRTLVREPQWRRAGGLMRVLFAGALLPAALGALIGAALLAGLGVAPFLAVLPNWFIGTLTGSVAILPLALALFDGKPGEARRVLLTPPSLAALALIAALVVAAPQLLEQPFVFMAAGMLLGAAAGGVPTACVGLLLGTLLFNLGIALQWYPAALGGHGPVAVFGPWLACLVPAALFAATLESERRALAERAAQASSVRRLYDLTPALALAADPNGHIVQSTRRWREHFGYAEQIVEGQSLRLHVHDRSGPTFEAFWQRSLSDTGQAAVAELDWLHADDRTVPVRASLDWERDDLGHGQRALLVLEDLTALRATVERLAAERERNRKLLLASSDAVITTDGDGVVTDLNPAAHALLALASDAGIGQAWDDVVRLRGTEDAIAPAPLARAKAQPGQPVQFDAQIMGANGAAVDVQGETVAIASSTPGQVLATVTTLADRTRQHAAERALREAEATARAASRAKTHFLSNMSHEIRTPLNAVVGLAMTMDEASLPPAHAQTLTRIRIAARNLLGVVNDILDVTKIEAGEMLLDERPFNLFDVLGEVEALYAPQARAQGLSFAVGVAPDVPLQMIGDAQRLTQMLSNLLSNAIKFTEQGAVSLTVACEEREPAPHAGAMHLRFSVRDTGPGVPSDVQPRLFQPFVQADASTTRRHGGSGLGLSIVRQLAQLMKGSTGCDSDGVSGSTFWATVELQPLDSGDIHSVRKGALEIWIVDDVEMDRLSAVRSARALGWFAVAINDGQDLLDQLQARLSQGQRPPDALLLDWWMPGLDGLSLLRQVHELLPGPQRPIQLLMSGHDLELLQGLGAEQVVDGLLEKPVQQHRLFNALDAAAVKRGGGLQLLEHTQLDDDLSWLAGLRVLVVDDVQDNLEVATRLLARMGAQAAKASSGAQALQMLNDGAFDAVLMDVQMPEMDGRETTLQIRQNPRLDRTAVIALTAGAFVDERRQALEAGMDEFVTKPFSPAGLVRAVRRALLQRRGESVPVLAAEKPPNPAPPDAPDEWPLIEGLDREAARTRLGNDASLLWQLLRGLLREFAEFCQRPPDIAGEGLGRDRVARTVHKLRGSAGTVGAQNLAQAAAHMERLLRHEGTLDLDALRDQHRELAEAFTALREAVHRAELVYDRATDAHSRVAAAPPATDRDVAKLQTLLHDRDLAAIASFAQLRPALRARLGLERTEHVARAVEELDFTRAATLLNDSTP